MASFNRLLKMNLESKNFNWQMQLFADSAYPCGSFAHSQGLEAAYQLGLLARPEQLMDYLQTNLEQLYSQFSEIFTQTFQRPALIEDTDSLAASLLSNHIASSSSIKQGRALAKVSSQIFTAEAISHLFRMIEQEKIVGHHVPVMAYLLSQLNCELSEARQLWLHMHARSLLSAAVRLNIIGPVHSMRLLLDTASFVKQIIHSTARSKPLMYSCQQSPILEIAQGYQDRLYTRLFQS